MKLALRTVQPSEAAVWESFQEVLPVFPILSGIQIAVWVADMGCRASGVPILGTGLVEPQVWAHGCVI